MSHQIKSENNGMGKNKILITSTFNLLTSAFNTDGTGFDKVLDNNKVAIDASGDVTVTSNDPTTGTPSTIATTTISTDLTGGTHASGTYNYVSSTSTITITITSSNFVCAGPSVGTNTDTVTVNATTMIGIENNMTWTRTSGTATAGSIVGTWTTTDSTGNSFTITFNTDGTVSVVGNIVSCGSDGGGGGTTSTTSITIPTAAITVDGNTSDWTGISPMATDVQGDSSPSYTGDDIKSLYVAKDANNLYVRMDLWVILRLVLFICLTVVTHTACGGGDSGGGGGGNTPPSSAKTITVYLLAGVAGVIDETAKTISVSMPFGTNVTALVATFTTTGAGVKVGSTVQTSGTTANDFTNPVAYIITAADGTTATYTVTVTVAASSTSVVNLPKTGQTTCYDVTLGTVIACANTGTDGELQKGVAWPSQRFTVGTGTEVDCVTDNLTGLMWVKTPDSTTRTWADALTYANGLSLCGFDDWRLPNRKELRSLVNYEQANIATWLNTQGFSNVRADYYWSSSTFAYLPLYGYGWFVDMRGGNVFAYVKTSTYYVWPVRAGE